MKYILTILLISAASPGIAQSENAVAVDNKPVKEKKICLREAVTGSNLRAKSVCRTKAEWDEIKSKSAEEARENMERRPVLIKR